MLRAVAAESWRTDVRPTGVRTVRDTATGEVGEWALHERDDLRPGSAVRGPAIIAERETSTLVGPGWRAHLDAGGAIVLNREPT